MGGSKVLGVALGTASCNYCLFVHLQLCYYAGKIEVIVF